MIGYGSKGDVCLLEASRGGRKAGCIAKICLIPWEWGQRGSRGHSRYFASEKGYMKNSNNKSHNYPFTLLPWMEVWKDKDICTGKVSLFISDIWPFWIFKRQIIFFFNQHERNYLRDRCRACIQSYKVYKWNIVLRDRAQTLHSNLVWGLVSLEGLGM